MKSHSIEVAFDPLYKKGPQENREKGNTLFGHNSVRINETLLECNNINLSENVNPDIFNIF